MLNGKGFISLRIPPGPYSISCYLIISDPKNLQSKPGRNSDVFWRTNISERERERERERPKRKNESSFFRKSTCKIGRWQVLTLGKSSKWFASDFFLRTHMASCHHRWLKRKGWFAQRKIAFYILNRNDSFSRSCIFSLPNLAPNFHHGPTTTGKCPG